jgi:hypothetical protein
MPLDAKVERGVAVKLFAQEAEYYQDITFPATNTETGFRMIVDVLDPLSIGAGTMIPGNESQRVKLFTENLVLASRFAAKSVQISCHTLVCNRQSTLGVSPAPKSDFDAAQQFGPGAPGARGDDAGDILLLVESIDETNPDTFPLLNARGGRGQNGQHSQTDVGGAPGCGGNGGNVTVVYGSPNKRAVVAIRQALNNLDGPNARLILSALQAVPDQDMMLPSGKTLAAQISDTDPLVQAMNELFLSSAQDRAAIDATEITRKLRLITNTLSAVLDTLQTRVQQIETEIIYPRILNKAGDTGSYGSGPKGSSAQQPAGLEPKHGRILVKAVADLSELDWVADDGIDCRTLVSDMQSAMLLQKARMAYFYGDVSEGSTAKDTAALAKTLLDRLISRLSFVDKMKLPALAGDPTGIFPRLQSVLRGATDYQKQFDLGLDYYGHAYGQIPLLTLERYQSQVHESSTYFTTIETQYAEYFSYLIQNKSEASQLKAAGSNLTAAKKQLEQDQQVLRETAGRMAFDISSLTDSVTFKRATLDTALERFSGDLKNYFNCDIKALLSGLSTIAFAPDSAAMWATQASSWLYNGFTTIPDDSGEAINKDLVVQKVATVQANVAAITEGFKQINSGLFEADDPGANKLIAAQKDLSKFIDDFQTRFKDDTQNIKAAFNDYVATVIARNNKILGYNAAISLLLRKKQQVEDCKAREQDVQTQMANQASPALPAMTATMSVFYHTARDQLMELLYLMTRAYQFRALDNTNLIAKYMSENVLTPATMTNSTISTLYATSDAQSHLISGIAWEWLKAEEKMAKYQVSEFPDTPDKWGALYAFTDLETLETFKQVRTLSDKAQIHSVSLPIHAVFRNTPTNGNALAQMSDIRLTNVRAWLDGVRVTGDSDPAPRLLIDIVHSGNESIVNPAGKLFMFNHEAVVKFFSYHPDQLPPDPRTFPRAAIFADREIERSGDQPAYALIGPFTTWEVRLTNSYAQRAGLLDELEVAKAGPASYQGLQGRDITCEYPSHSPIVGKVGTVTANGRAVTLEVLNIAKRVAEILSIEDKRVVSKKVLKESEILNPNDAISLACNADGPKLDFSKFTGIRLEFSGKGRSFSVSRRRPL